MKPLPPSALHHLAAAEGWLELGNLTEANEELEKIPPRLRAHPDLVTVRYQIFSSAGKWDACLDIGTAHSTADEFAFPVKRGLLRSQTLLVCLDLQMGIQGLLGCLNIWCPPKGAW